MTKLLRIFIAIAIFSLGTVEVHAQFGNLINKGINAVNKVKNAKKIKDDVMKNVNNDIDILYDNEHIGIYRARTHEIILDKTYTSGQNDGKKVVYTINFETGDIVFGESRVIGSIQGNTLNCRNVSPYLVVDDQGNVKMDNETIGRITNSGDVSLLGHNIGKLPNVNKMIAAFIFYGIVNDKSSIGRFKQYVQNQKAKAATQNTQRQSQQSYSNNARGNKTNTQQKVREWGIEKNGSRGYVDANGVVYDWGHIKIGQLPKGNGDICDRNGRTVGRIFSDEIMDSSGNMIARVTPGGSINVSGSTKTVAEIRAGGRIDRMEDSRTLGTCEVDNVVWQTAIIFCDFFQF